MRSVPALLLALVAVGSAPGSVQADPVAEGRFFYERARERYERRDYEGALRLFLRAYEAAPSARMLYNVALSAQRADRPDLAYSSFEEYLTEPRDDEARRRDARQRLRRLAGRLALLEVTTEPEGAVLYVDRRDRGSYGRAPRTLPLLRQGRVVVRAERAGHHPAEAEVEVAVGERRRLHLDLTPRTGTLRVRPRPRGTAARVLQGGETVATTEGDTSVELPVGDYRVITAAPGHAEASATVRLRDGRTETVILVAHPLPPPTGRLLVDTGDVQATVELDGRRIGLTPLSVDSVPAGTHRLQVRAEDRLTAERAVEIAEDRATYVNVTLVPRR